MGYVRNNLLPGEHVVYETRTHWRVFISPVISLVIGAYLAYLLADSCVIFAYIFIGVALLKSIPAVIKYLTDEYAVTNRRLILKQGALTTRSLELPLDKIASMAVVEPLLGRMLGYGSIRCHSGADPQTFFNISAPQEFRRKAMQQAQQLHP